MTRLTTILALGLMLTGCERMTDAYCSVFSATEMCCNRLPSHGWNPGTHTCDPIFLGS